jgi:cysteinyl-tRNA synthetase
MRSIHLKLYNTMIRGKETFKPMVPGKAKIFTCGPSTYQRPHIGNYKSFLYEDVLVRYLTYLGYSVDRVINFTDVEDKTISEAENKGRNVKEITANVNKHFFNETKLLGILLPDVIPRASTSIDEAVMIIKKLVEKGFAYWHKGSVFFDPLKHKGFGRLFGLDMSTWPKRKVRFKRDTYEGRRWNRGDFILWHGERNQNDPSAYWETEIGPGRPAWNIQDPAMIVQLLGNQIDINCGGIDNIYRHHDYNIAVMESYSGKNFCNYFLHGEHLIVDGTVMSKSKGNVLYPDDLMEKGYEPKHLRFCLTYTHYRKKLNFTQKGFEKASEKLDTFRALVKELLSGASGKGNKQDEVIRLAGDIPGVFQNSMDDDLSTGMAFDALYELLLKIRDTAGDKGLHRDVAKTLRAGLEKADSVFGVIF